MHSKRNIAQNILQQKKKTETAPCYPIHHADPRKLSVGTGTISFQNKKAELGKHNTIPAEKGTWKLISGTKNIIRMCQRPGTIYLRSA